MNTKIARLAGRGALAASILVHLTCHQALFTAPPGSTLNLSANPIRIPAHGSVSVVTAFVRDQTGNPVADGTVVQFFTTLGRIQEQGKTNDGVARVNLSSDSRSGTASVTAFSGDTDGAVDITIGAVLPARVFVRAEPSIITVSRSSHIIATVLDEDGNPVANVPVVFTVSNTLPPTTPPQPPPTSATEFMESSSQPIFTNNNGEAEDVLRTRRLAGATGVVFVTATVLNASATTATTSVQLDLR